MVRGAAGGALGVPEPLNSERSATGAGVGETMGVGAFAGSGGMDTGLVFLGDAISLLHQKKAKSGGQFAYKPRCGVFCSIFRGEPPKNITPTLDRQPKVIGESWGEVKGRPGNITIGEFWKAVFGVLRRLYVNTSFYPRILRNIRYGWLIAPQRATLAKHHKLSLPGGAR